MLRGLRFAVPQSASGELLGTDAVGDHRGTGNEYVWDTYRWTTGVGESGSGGNRGGVEQNEVGDGTLAHDATIGQAEAASGAGGQMGHAVLKAQEAFFAHVMAR